MILLRWEEGCAPGYQSRNSAAADLHARIDTVIPAGGRGRVPVGVWIAKVLWEDVPEGMIPELQVRARSGLAFKHGVNLTNGVGTVDADYPDEIGVLLSNTGDKDFVVSKGDRIAQLLMNLVLRIPELPVGGDRSGGFGSTGH